MVVEFSLSADSYAMTLSARWYCLNPEEFQTWALSLGNVHLDWEVDTCRPESQPPQGCSVLTQGRRLWSEVVLAGELHCRGGNSASPWGSGALIIPSSPPRPLNDFASTLPSETAAAFSRQCNSITSQQTQAGGNHALGVPCSRVTTGGCPLQMEHCSHCGRAQHDKTGRFSKKALFSFLTSHFCSASWEVGSSSLKRKFIDSKKNSERMYCE